MKHHIPRSPFATRLSGSAKETELRLRNIFQWKKKRPPAVLLIPAALIALFCGSLVSCQPRQEEPPLDGDIPSEDTAIDGNAVSEDTEEPQELTAASGQDEPLSSKIQMLFLPWEHKLWQEPMEGLTEEQKELLENLPVDELPREPVKLSDLFRDRIWQDTLIPLAADPENDVTLYGVVSAESVPKVGSLVGIISQHLDDDGIVLRYGDQAIYYPLSWNANAWYGVNPWVSARDFDGDGKEEAAVCLYVGRGTGVHVENLYFFDLDTMTYTVPDYSDFGEIEVEYDPAAHTATLTSTADNLTVDVPEYLEPLGEGACGSIVYFYEKDGQIYCRVGLDFYGAAAYLAYAAAPVIWQEGGYGLGEITFSITASERA